MQKVSTTAFEGRYAFEFDFGPEEYRSYVQLRDKKDLRMFSALGAVCLLPLGLLMLPAAFSMKDPSSTVYILLAVALGLLMLAMAIRGRGPWIEFTRRSSLRAYLGRHGADGEGETASFRQRVVLGEEGIELSFGPKEQWPKGACTIDKPWSEWERACANGEGVLVACRTGQGGCLTAMLGHNALIRMAERDKFQDAFVPASALGSMQADELVGYARERIKAARRR